MEFIKKNYEKIVLVVVLLGLTAASCILPIIISEKRKALEEKRFTTKANPKPVLPPDMTMEDASLTKAQTPVVLDYTNQHNLFNPVIWKKFPDGRLVKETAAEVEGASALQVTAIKPLYLIISYSSPSGSGYLFRIERQGALEDSKRVMQRFVSKDNPSELLKLVQVKGPADKPTEFDLEWAESGKQMVVTPEKVYKEIDAYSADLKYSPENKTWADRKALSAPLNFAGGKYKIVAISSSNVVVSAESNDKKTTITFHSANEPR